MFCPLDSLSTSLLSSFLFSTFVGGELVRLGKLIGVLVSATLI